ncbi:serine hydrolase domain-containing protein [Pontibacter ummariensis]|nr:serine hydrolase domain-containing protein [Pontibacter ummariensis]
MLTIFALLASLTNTTFPGYAQKTGAGNTGSAIHALEREIRNILEDTGTPAAGVAIYQKGNPLYAKGFGLANVEKGVVATEETMFRIGSVSKLFVGLAVLKLQEEGKLQLRDKLSVLAPEIEYKNPWEQTHPIRIEHLLSHTTGWDDIHLAEYLHNDPTPATLKEGLDFHPHSRVSRWVPGTRMAYSNSGPAVAAYVVQKVTGQPFEDYVAENFFKPMGMETITYFPSEGYKRLGATLYERGRPVDYWHVITRPTGSINASPKDMGKLISFFLNRGKAGSTQLLSPSSIKRMETPTNTLGAKAGLELGYGLANYTREYKGHVFHGHGGSLNGGKALFSYLPEQEVGFFVSINTSQTETLNRLTEAIQKYLLKDVPPPAVASLPTRVQLKKPISGFYYIINPREEMWTFIYPLFSQKIWTVGNSFLIDRTGLFGNDEDERYVSVDDKLLMNPESGLIEVAVVDDPIQGRGLEVAAEDGEPGNLSFASISPFRFYLLWAIMLLWLVLILWSVLSFPVWSIRYAFGKLKGGRNIWMRFWSFMSILFLIAVIAITTTGFPEDSFGRPTILSVTLTACTIAYALTGALALYHVFFAFFEGKVRKGVLWPAAMFSVLNFLVILFFMWHGVIGIRTWA